MKIISNRECYVQKDDLVYLIDNDYNVPSEIIYNLTRAVNDESDFVKIEDDISIEYILGSDVPSFDDLNSLRIEEIQTRIDRLRSSFFDGWIDSNEETSREELINMIQDKRNKEYLLKQLMEILAYKKRISTLKYPDVPYGGMVTFTDGVLNASLSINQDKVLIYKSNKTHTGIAMLKATKH